VADVALLGAGYWGRRLLRALLEVPGVDRVHCFDPRPDVRAWVGGHFGTVEVADRPERLLDDQRIAGAVIATPAATHATLAAHWLASGRHVLVEKPIALDPNTAIELTELAARRGRALLPGHTYLYSGAARALRALVRNGDLGRPVWLQSDRLNLGRFRPDVSVLWDLAPHDAALLVDLLDAEVTSCHALGWPQGTSAPDVCSVLLATAEGTGVGWHLSWRAPEKVRRVMLVGSDATAIWDDLDATWPIKVYTTQFGHVGSAGAGEYQARLGQCLIPTVDRTEPLLRECRHFVDVLLGVSAPCVGPEHIIKVTSILAQAEAALFRS